MTKEHPIGTPGALDVYSEYERQITVRHLKVGCWLVICLMPAGVILDHYVYEPQASFFLWLRLTCSALEGVLWGLLFTRWGQREHRSLGLLVAMLPVFFISRMIYDTGEPASPYYAGLNLILLAIAFVLRWDVGLSLVAILLSLASYLTACLSNGPISSESLPGFVNNLYFLILTGIVVVFGSLTHRRLRLREFKLRYELDQSREQLEQTNRRLVELDQIKSRFFANISHELRTPLTLLLAPLETLQHRRADLTEDEIQEVLVGMFTNGMRLLKLINDLLELVRLDAGIMRVDRESVDLGTFLRGLVSSAREAAERKKLKLETSIDPALGRVMVDRDKLEKIVLNLQFNALKFTPAEGRVDILARREGEELVIDVKDTGTGISEQNLPHVFSRFWQADTSARRKYQGVGIGLALVKELTELQGGKVSVQSQEGKGTTFTVRLPYIVALEEESTGVGVAAPQEAASPGKGEGGEAQQEEWLTNLYRRAELLPTILSARQATKARRSAQNGDAPQVLIADDEPDMLRFLRMQLQGHYQILEASDGLQALEEANRLLPDLILLDMMMPEMDGLQVCRELRSRTPTQTIPILLLTARADEETKMAALSAGANDFLPKPFSTTELQVRVRNLVESYDYQRRVAKQNVLLEDTIDQLKETETQLVQTEKLASLGRMSAGIIHEINNPLNYAKTGLYTLRQHALRLPPEQRACFEDLLSEIEDGLNRVKNIVLELRPFTRPAPGAFDLQDVNQMIDTALRLLSHEWKDQVKVERAVPAGLSAWANQAHVIQVLVNLMQNALDALKQKPPASGEPTVWISGRQADDRCLLTIRDNGPGIPADIMPKIFEPFFTTKDVGAGMGLGLNICYRIMQAHGGKIRAESQPGKFCAFHLEFAAREPATADSTEATHG